MLLGCDDVAPQIQAVTDGRAFMLKITHLFSLLIVCSLAIAAGPISAKTLKKSEPSKTKVLRPGKRLYPRGKPVNPVPRRTKGKTLTPTTPSTSNNNCSARRSYMEQEQEKLDGYRANLAGINVEIAQLNRRIRELRAQAKDTKRIVNSQDQRVRRIKGVYERECKKNENCGQYEKTAASLERQSGPVENNLGRVRQEIGRTRTEINSLQRRIRPLQSEYSAKKCANQVPGKTSQATIDRCYAIFSDWNQLQASLNHHNARLPQLKTQYERYVAQLTSIDNRAQRIALYLEQNCKSSPKRKTIKRHRSVKENAKRLGAELDQLIRQVSDLRKVKITVKR